jgi:hypothetical protein
MFNTHLSYNLVWLWQPFVFVNYATLSSAHKFHIKREYLYIFCLLINLHLSKAWSIYLTFDGGAFSFPGLFMW